MSMQPYVTGTAILDALAADRKPRRPIPEIQADLDGRKAEHRRLMPLVEAEGKKEGKSRDKIAKAQLKWRVEYPEDPFDPNSFEPPLRQYKGDPKLYESFHAVHYAIASLETELAAAQKARAAGEV